MSTDDLRDRRAPLEMGPEAFREAGHRLVDEIAAFLESLPRRPVTRDEAPGALRALLPAELADEGAPPGELLAEAAPLLFDQLASQRAPDVPRLHHVFGSAHRGARRPAGGRGQPQRGRVATVSYRLRDRGAVHAFCWPACSGCRTRPRVCW